MSSNVAESFINRMAFKACAFGVDDFANAAFFVRGIARWVELISNQKRTIRINDFVWLVLNGR